MSNVSSTFIRNFLLACLASAVTVGAMPGAQAQNAVEQRAQEQEQSDDDEQSELEVGSRNRRHRHDNGIVSFGHDSVNPAGEHVAAVVSIFGSSTNEGEVQDAVVSIFGNTRVTGPVGEAAVAVMGSVYVNSEVGGDVVAVMGNVELGPAADIDGNVVVVGGTLKRDPAARIQGTIDRVSVGGLPQFDWMKPWIKHALLYGRPLALEPGLGWAWTLALGFLALYALLALLFKGAVDRCVSTLEMQPGRSILASLLTLVLTPFAFIVLFVTVIGVFLVPFFALALFCASLFGKAVMLAAIGRRLTRRNEQSVLGHTAVAVIVGGVLVLALYLIPVIGFITYKVLGILGLGVVAYTLLLATKEARRDRIAAVPPAAAAAPAHAAPLATPVTATEPSVSAEPQPAVSSPSETAAPEPPVAVAISTLPRAGFWIRMGALAIDAILIGVLFGVFMDFGGIDGDRAWLVALAAYGAIMWKMRGTTIGGTVFGLQVVRVDGRPIDWGTAIVRALGCFLSLIVAGLGFIWIVFDEGKQAWHDKIAGTAVVQPPKGVSLL